MLKFGLALWMACGLFLCSVTRAEQLTTVEEAIHKVFPEATGLDREELCLTPDEVARIEKSAEVTFKGGHSSKVTRIVLKKGDAVIGMAVEDSVPGRWGLIRYLVGVDNSGAVAGVVILEHKEVRGKPIVKSRFLKQYFGKTVANPVQLKKDIDGVTGATVSSRALTDGVRKNLYILKEIQGVNGRAVCR